MKETFIGISVLILALIAYVNMPMEWRRHKDIKFGNQLIENVQTYQKQHRRLPENHDKALLLQLGFRENKQGWQPNYRQINAQDFQIIYADGYVPPYLAWDSQGKTWALVEK